MWMDVGGLWTDIDGVVFYVSGPDGLGSMRPILDLGRARGEAKRYLGTFLTAVAFADADKGLYRDRGQGRGIMRRLGCGYLTRRHGVNPECVCLVWSHTGTYRMSVPSRTLGDRAVGWMVPVMGWAGLDMGGGGPVPSHLRWCRCHYRCCFCCCASIPCALVHIPYDLTVDWSFCCQVPGLRFLALPTGPVDWCVGQTLSFIICRIQTAQYQSFVDDRNDLLGVALAAILPCTY